MNDQMRNVMMAVLCLLLVVGIQGRFAGGADGEAGSGVLGKPANMAFENFEVKQGLITGKSAIYADRKEYWADDETGQFVIGLMLPGGAQTQPAAAASSVALETGAQTGDTSSAVQKGKAAPRANPVAAKMVAELSSGAAGKGTVVGRVEYADPLYQKFQLLMKPQGLQVGDYRLTAWLEDGAGAKGVEASWEFKKSARKSDAIAFPADGLPVTLEPLSDTRAMSVPVRLAIPLPKGAVKDVADFAITRDGKEVLSQSKGLVQWGPGASWRWAEARFVAQYQDGKAEGYRLIKRKAGEKPQAPGVTVQETADDITVDNGTLKFTVSRKAFAGIQKAWFDASGKGKYNIDKPVIFARENESGPFLMDERLIKFTSAADKATVVKVEDAGPESVTLVASGWYTDREKRVAPLCQYQVRLTLVAGQPEVLVSHNTVITFDTRDHKIRDLGFAINYLGADRYAFGVDGSGVVGKLPGGAPTAPKRAGEQAIYPAVFMHQKTWDLCTVTGVDGKGVDGKKSDGWVATWGEEQPALCVTLKDVWEKFPKELEARSEAIVVHAWPKNGKRVFKLDDELALKNIYKYWCFHQHPMMDLNLPQDYYQVLASLAGTETNETRAEHALNGNGQGMTLSTQMRVGVRVGVLAEDEKAESLSAACLKDSKLFEMTPYATLSPEWNAGTQALEAIGAVNGDFKAFEDTIIAGLLSYNASVERGQEYGMFIWPDTHTYWLPAEGRSSLHRTWQNSHYHQVGNSWMLWFRSGDARMLRWARDNSAHFRDVGTIAYAEPGSPETAIPFHLPGAMYHCKGCTPWGSETQGMIRRDTHAGLWGHWVDSDAHLYAWLIDGEARGQDMYKLWLASLKTYGFLSGGVRREANTTLALLVNAYEFSGDPDYLPAIWNLGLTLRTKEPLESQQPGPMWHPLWINRYYHLTRDPAYIEFVLKYGRMPGLGGTWNLALSALAYEVSGDKSFLTQQLPSIQSFPRNLYRCPGDPYDNYGMGPGPLGMGWGEMGVGSYMRALKHAGITGFPTEATMHPDAAYPVLIDRKKMGSEFWALSKTGGALAIESFARGVEGDAHNAEFVLKDADGKVLSSAPTRQANQVVLKAEVNVPVGSAVSVAFAGYGGIGMATKGFDAQAGLLMAGGVYGTSRTRFLMEPVGAARPTTLNFEAAGGAGGGDRSVVSVIVKDANGNTLADASLHSVFQNKKTTVVLDPSKNPLPWTVDLVGATRFTVVSETPAWMIGASKTDLKVMKPWLEKAAAKAAAK
jgi:hypothetical protein